MSRIYKGPAPCAGCGVPGTEHGRVSKDDICSTCKNHIKIGRQIKETSNEFGRVTLDPYSLKRFVLREIVSDKFNDLKHTNSERFSYCKGDTDKVVLENLKVFLSAIDEGDKGGTGTYSLTMEDSGSYRTTVVYLKKEAIIPLFNLLNSIAIFTQEIRKEAFLEGSNLLVSLNSGSITLDQLEDRRKGYLKT